jgi:hypothetical protein
VSKKPKPADVPKVSMDEFLAPIRAWRKKVGEERWEQHKREEQTKAVQWAIDARREFAEFEASDEGKARAKLMLRLKELTADETIAQSETCIELLDALHHCLDHKFMAEGSGDVIAVLTPHFSRMGSPGAGGRAKAEAQVRKDEDHRKLLRQHPGLDAVAQRKLLQREFVLGLDPAKLIVRRWRESEEGKKATAASTRKSSTTGKPQKPPTQT